MTEIIAISAAAFFSLWLLALAIPQLRSRVELLFSRHEEPLRILIAVITFPVWAILGFLSLGSLVSFYRATGLVFQVPVIEGSLFVVSVSMAWWCIHSIGRKLGQVIRAKKKGQVGT